MGPMGPRGLGPIKQKVVDHHHPDHDHDHDDDDDHDQDDDDITNKDITKDIHKTPGASPVCQTFFFAGFWASQKMSISKK